MRTTTQLSVTLPNEMAEAVKSRVASGEYASESEVIRDGLRTLLARDAAMEHWLRTEVVAAYDELEANPTWAITSAQLRQRLARRQSDRIHQG
ncbi:type II toxin-antitoxin system ParD family antitoxin [Mobiluncus mulieris]|uniref:type II toxin-antitoxin system ParD family antitoxin n=1 Tax=Mobiluncus mulieris TaxID=2052 RepID=UPI00147020FA|nr:type II toxin-antitoxin system ParD family antitoxin [Mobiluncus mulieris]NMW59610.1 type II toxin-antitoxin system ParD family antitoxin [Mobiluncus mulieris]